MTSPHSHRSDHPAHELIALLLAENDSDTRTELMMEIVGILAWSFHYQLQHDEANCSHGMPSGLEFELARRQFGTVMGAIHTAVHSLHDERAIRN